MEMAENYAILTCFDDPDGTGRVGTLAFFPSLDAAESYKLEMEEANPNCDVTIFRYAERPNSCRVSRLGFRGTQTA